jgi:glycosyltransferase involved in cell wall biosynthesis
MKVAYWVSSMPALAASITPSARGRARPKHSIQQVTVRIQYHETFIGPLSTLKLRRDALMVTAPPRLLFCSPHCYLDTSSGAALATRGLLELLARRGWPCAVYCSDVLDFEHPPPLEQLLRQQGLSFTSQPALANGSPFSLYHLVATGVPVSLFATPETGAGRPATRDAGITFLRLLEGILDRFRPDIVLLYGGNELARSMMARVRRREIPVVFALHNLAYHDRHMFEAVTAIVVPSQFARDHYQHYLGLDCQVLPLVWDWDKIRCQVVDGRYVSFINPQPEKGVFWFVRMATELARRRPDIPLLVVEGRAKVEWLQRTGLDLSGVTNLHRMANTPDPRDFYGISRVLLFPSLCQEVLPRVAVEASINGIPVLASRRGGLPEVLEDAGFLFDIADSWTPEVRIVPSAEDVAPWLAVLERLWDDSAWYAEQRLRSLAMAERFRPEHVLPAYDTFFRSLSPRDPNS